MEDRTFLDLVIPPEIIPPIYDNEVEHYEYTNEEGPDLFENRIQMIQPSITDRRFHLADPKNYSAAADSVLSSKYSNIIEPKDITEEEDFPLKQALADIEVDKVVSEVITFFNEFIGEHITFPLLDYIENPTITNYDKVAKRLWICSSTAALYSAYLSNEENLRLFTDELAEQDDSANVDTIITSLNYIVEHTPQVVESLNYAKSAKRNDFRPLPPKETNIQYVFSVNTFMNMLMEFTGIIEPNTLPSIIFFYYGIIEDIIQPHSPVISATDLIHLYRSELKSKVDEGSYVLIMHVLNLFVVYGNFVIEDGVVTSIESPYIQTHEFQRTAFIYIDSHGVITTNIPSEPFTEVELTPQLNRVPNGMNLFVQKFGEPLCPMYLQSYLPGIYCTTKCIKEGKRKCDCEFNVSIGYTVKELSHDLDDLLKNNKLPSLFYLHSKRNNDFRQRNLTEDIYEFSSIVSRAKIRENMPIRNIARIPTTVNEYLNKRYTIDLKNTIGKGIYNLISGELINSNPSFIEYITNRYPYHFMDMIDAVRSFKVDNYVVNLDFKTSCMYVKLYYLSDIIGYFESLNYTNILAIDDSCETYYPANPPEVENDSTLSEERLQELKEKTDAAIKEVGDYGLGIRKLNKQKKSKKYSKKYSKKSKKMLRKNSRKKQKRFHPTKRTRKIYFKSI